MTYTNDCTLPAELLEQIASQGFNALPELIRIVINTAMQAERQKYLRAAPFEHSPDRQGHANGYKPKTVKTRLEEITFDIPQVREGGFYPEALEKGLRSERALRLALAEMYVQGVSTRKVAAITEQLGGIEISSTQVSRAAALLDETLAAWRKRPLGEIVYLFLDARYEKACQALLVAITQLAHHSQIDHPNHTTLDDDQVAAMGFGMVKAVLKHLFDDAGSGI